MISFFFMTPNSTIVFRGFSTERELKYVLEALAQNEQLALLEALTQNVQDLALFIPKNCRFFTQKQKQAQNLKFGMKN